MKTVTRFLDSFDVDSSAEYTQYAETVGTWTWDTVNSLVKNTGGKQDILLYNGFTGRDVIVEAAPGRIDDGGLVVRFVDTNQYYLLAIRDNETAHGTTISNLAFYKKTALGTFTVLKDADPSMPRGTYTVRLEAIGNRFTVFVNETEIFSVVDTTFASGQVGLRSYAGDATYENHYKSFTVKEGLGYEYAVRKNSPAGYWRLGEASGSVAKDAVGTNEGTYLNAPILGVAGALADDTDTAVQFDGIGKYVRVPYAAELISRIAFTVEAWVYPTDDPIGSAVITQEYTGTHIAYELGFGMHLGGAPANNNLAFGYYESGYGWKAVEDTEAAVLNQWTHAVGTWDGTTLRLYKNGALVASAVPTRGAPPVIANDILLARRHDTPGTALAGTAFFPGIVDEPVFYPNTLSGTEVLEHYELAQPSELPPVAAFTTTVTAPSVAVDASTSSDPENQPLTYSWDWGDGTVAGIGVTAEHIYAVSGDYLITLTVTDAAGLTDTATELVRVNRAPIADFTAVFDPVQGSISVDATTSSDPDGDAITYAWDWGDGTATGSGVTAEHVYQNAGTYVVVLTVTDSLGATSTAQTTVTVSNKPVASFITVTSRLTVAFDASASYDLDGTIVSYTWDFGDGNTGAGVAPTHGYKESGTYTVSLTVTDDVGRTATTTLRVFPKSYDVDGASIERRPDAVSLDHKIAFSYGPIAHQNPTEGLAYKAWRIRLVGNILYLEGEIPGGWGDTEILYTFEDGTYVEELSLAFNQNAEAMFAAEIAGDVYVYRYDAINERWILENFGAGRSPRIVLDLPGDPPHSDLHLFYFSDILDGLAYRTQRENFQTERVIPTLLSAANRFMEKALPTSGNRMRLIYSERDLAAGQYVIKSIYSKLLVDPEGPGTVFKDLVELGAEGREVFLWDIVIPIWEEDEVKVGSTAYSLYLEDTLIERTEVNEVNVGSTAQELQLPEIVIVTTGVDEASVGAAGQNLILDDIVIVPTAEVNEASVGATAQEVTLVTV